MKKEIYYIILINKMIIEYNKRIGETMTELINRFKKEYQIEHNKISYAGRLDPLAGGNIIILTEEDVYRKKEFCNRIKEYETWIIRDIITDTYDIMGIIKREEKEIEELKIGEYEQEYPAYSSYKVDCIIKDKIKKIPLWMATKNGYKIIEKKKKIINLYEYELIEEKEIDKSELLEIVEERIKRVIPQTFRQKDIIEEWQKIEDKKYRIEKYRFILSSGGYVRYLGNKIKGCCFDIERKRFL